MQQYFIKVHVCTDVYSMCMYSIESRISSVRMEGWTIAAGSKQHHSVRLLLWLLQLHLKQ